MFRQKYPATGGCGALIHENTAVDGGNTVLLTGTGRTAAEIRRRSVSGKRATGHGNGENCSLLESAVDVSSVPEHYQVVKVARAAVLLEPEDDLPGMGFGFPRTSTIKGFALMTKGKFLRAMRGGYMSKRTHCFSVVGMRSKTELAGIVDSLPQQLARTAGLDWHHRKLVHVMVANAPLVVGGLAGQIFINEAKALFKASGEPIE